MVDVVLLLAEKVRRHAIERVARQLVVALDADKHVHLHAPFNVDQLCRARARLLGLGDFVAHARRRAPHTPPEWEILDLQHLGARDEVANVKHDDIVPRDDVHVYGDEKVAPRAQQVCFVVKADNLGARDPSTRVERKAILDERLRAALQRHHVGNLDDRVHVRLGENARPACAFYVKAQDAQRRHVHKLALGLVREDVAVVDVDFELDVARSAHVVPRARPRTLAPRAAAELHPRAAHHLAFHHKSQLVRQLALEQFKLYRGGAIGDAILKQLCRVARDARVRDGDFEKGCRLVKPVKVDVLAIHDAD